ncbi:MAG: D-amino acid dehydrogenase [Pseudomonadota bacterium]
MQVAVIGGGIAGVSTAFFLAQAGHEVVVIERQSNVAEGASFGNAGTASPTHALPWAAPGMPGKLLSMLLKAQGPIFVKPRWNRSLWRWARRWMNECDIERHRINTERLYRLGAYSQEIMAQLRSQFPFEYERTQGYLQLYRNLAEQTNAAPLHAMLVEREVPHRLMDAEEAYLVEPALSRSAKLAGALHLPQDDAGNCPLFCKQLRSAAQTIGVNFHFGTEVAAIGPPDIGKTGLHVEMGEQRFAVDAVVVASGAGSQRLLEPMGIRLPFFPVRTYAATASIRNFDDAPLASLAEASNRVAITRMGTRMRLAGLAEVGMRSEETHKGAIRALLKIGQDWFPDAANYNTATLWSDVLPMLPDGPPILGPTPVRNLYLNIGHGTASWALAAGAGRILADVISGHQPDIDTEGLGMRRFT